MLNSRPKTPRGTGARATRTMVAALTAFAVIGLGAIVAFGASSAPATNATPNAAPTAATSAAKAGGAQPTPSAAPKAAAKRAAPHKIVTRLSKAETQVEPAKARLLIKQDSWVFTQPTRWSRHVARVHKGMYVIVIGSTLYYLKVHLTKENVDGYLAQSAVDLIKPANKMFTLTHDAAVRDRISPYAKKIAEVHRGRYVHVIGIALGYLQIQMHNGTRGFIPASAAE